MTVAAPTSGGASRAHDQVDPLIDRVRFTLEPIADPAAPAAQWRALEPEAAPSFFRSWDWIGPWLDCLPAERERGLAVGRLDGRIVALGVLVFGQRPRFGRGAVRVAHLNDSSVAAERTPTIEHNGLLVARTLERAIMPRFARWVVDGLADELVVPGTAAELLGVGLGGIGLGGIGLGGIGLGGMGQGTAGLVGRAQREVAPFVDLAGLRQRRIAYRDALSGNTRAQLRRALRDYGAAGPVVARPAASVAEARAYLDRLAVLHQAHWTARGQPGAFASPFFCRLHAAIIDRGFDRGAIQLLRITAGTTEIGYLYNLIRDGWVAAYQSGFAYESGGRSKPGLVSHVLAVELNDSLGAGRYDFLAGLNQLKQSLATQKENLHWWVVKPARFEARLEHGLRSLKYRLKQIGGKSKPNTVLSRCKRLVQV
jgi:CelD/BcsL family acetyltransferase involved in cellulose biosynthesis